MKRLVATALVALMLASCQEAPKGYVINGEVTGRTEGKVYLKSFRNKMFFDVDTAELKEGKFTFKGEVDQPLLFGLATEDMSYPVQFFVENTNMDVRINNDGETITVRNSPVNTIFQENAEKVFEEGYDIDSLITKYPASPAAAFYLYRYFTYQLPLDELKATRAKISSELAGCPYVKDLDGIIKQLENVQIGKVAPEFSLPDTAGVSVSLSDFRGKYVLLDFWASWCGPCRSEMPEIQALYEKYGKNEKDLIVLGVAGPNQGNEGSTASIKKFLKDNRYTFPVVMDESGDVFAEYGIRAFPTTFMIDKEGNIFGYVESALTGDVMESIVQQTMSGKRTS